MRSAVLLTATLVLAACSGDDVRSVVRDAVSGSSRTVEGEPLARDLQGRSALLSNAGNERWSVDAGSFDKSWNDNDRDGRLGDVTLYVKNEGQDILRVDEDSLDHTRFGTWLRTEETGGEGGALEAGAFAVPTDSLENDIPGNGTASYVGTVEGNYIATDTTERMVGTMSAEADFTAREVSVDLAIDSPSGPDTIRSGTIAIDVDRALGSRVGAFETNEATSDAGFSGELGGAFFGSNGDEIGGTFDLDRDEERYLGAFGGS